MLTSEFVYREYSVDCVAHLSTSSSLFLLASCICCGLNCVDLGYLHAENYESCCDDYAKALEMLKQIVEADSRILAEL